MQRVAQCRAAAAPAPQAGLVPRAGSTAQGGGDPCVALRWLGCSRKGVNVGSGVLGAGVAATNKE